jgi:hypothetical protein
VAFNTRVTVLGLKRPWGTRYHWELAGAGPKRNFASCTKEKNVLISKGLQEYKKEKGAEER